MVDLIQELKKSYEKNLLLELKNQKLKREHLVANRELLRKIRKNFEELVDEGGAGSPEADRMIRVIKNLEDMITAADKDLPDIDNQYKELVEMLKVRYPSTVEAFKTELERELMVEGVIETDRHKLITDIEDMDGETFNVKDDIRD